MCGSFLFCHGVCGVRVRIDDQQHIDSGVRGSLCSACLRIDNDMVSCGRLLLILWVDERNKTGDSGSWKYPSIENIEACAFAVPLP